MKTESGESERSNGGNGRANGTTRLSIPNNWILIVLVTLGGGGNLLTTLTGNQKINNNINSTAREIEVEKAVREIHEMHASLDEFEAREKKILDNQQKSIDKLEQALSEKP